MEQSVARAIRAYLVWGVAPDGRVRWNPANGYSAGPQSAWQSWFLAPESLPDSGVNDLVEWALVEGLLNKGSIQRVECPLELPLWWRGSGRWSAQDGGGWYASLVQAILAWTELSEEERGRWATAAPLLDCWDVEASQRSARRRTAARRLLRQAAGERWEALPGEGPERARNIAQLWEELGAAAEEAADTEIAAQDAAIAEHLLQEQKFLEAQMGWEAVASRPVLSRVDLDEHFPAPYFDREREALLSAVDDSCGEGMTEVLILDGSALPEDLRDWILRIGGVDSPPKRPPRPFI